MINMEKQFLKELTDAGEVKVNFEKKDLSLRRMLCTTNQDYLKGHADKTGWKEDASQSSNSSSEILTDRDIEKKVLSLSKILTVWDIENEGWRNISIAKVVFVMSNSNIEYIRFYQVIRKLDDSKFVNLNKKHISTLKEEHLLTLHKNLIGMFNTRFTGEQLKEMREKAGKDFNEPFGCNISDYAWTDEVENAFYEHPANKPIVTAMKRSGDMTWSMFVLDSEPSNIDHFESKPVIGEGF